MDFLHRLRDRVGFPACTHPKSPPFSPLPLPPSTRSMLVFECGGEKSIFVWSNISSEDRTLRRVVLSLPLGPPCDAVGNPPSLLLPCNSTFVSLLLEHQTVGAMGREPSQSAPSPSLSFLPTMDLIIACLLSVRKSCFKFPKGEGGCRAGRFSSLTHSKKFPLEIGSGHCAA